LTGLPLRHLLEAILPRRIRPQVATLIIAGTLLIVSACSRTPESRFTLQELEAHRRKDKPADMPERGLPNCPPAGSPVLQPSALTGHHKVILTWHASASSARPEDNAAGYCLYRSKKKDVAKKNATCGECEQVNPVPVVGTGCVDDLVQDGAVYYYVVSAMNAKRQTSSASNEILVAIPASKQAVSSTSAGSYPLCRSAASSK
jgi:hypothetical protein